MFSLSDSKLRSRTSDKPVPKLKVSDNNVVDKESKYTVKIVFISLLLDLLAFTMILPLLPSLMEHYHKYDDKDGLYPWLLDKVEHFRNLVGAPERFNSVLFGGLLGSLFSFLQFIGSPLVGGLSDVYGRKPLLILCLVGIALSYVLWAVSHSFAMFVLARVVGGISKGNVSLSMAIITDTSTTANRGFGMALVGIAFSVGFIVGPVIGAMFARWGQSQTENTDWFVMPALFALSLALADIIFVIFCFRETLPPKKRASLSQSISQATAYISVPALFNFTAVSGLPAKDSKELRMLGLVYFVYLFLYSGLELCISVDHGHVPDGKELRMLGLVYFVYLFLYSGLELCISVDHGHVPDSKELRMLGLVYFVYLFIYSGLALCISVDHGHVPDSKELRMLGLVYFVYLFLYSGLEFTLTFLTHLTFGFNSMQQGYMFFCIGLTMAVLQGGYVRRIPPSDTKKMASFGLLLVVPSFLCVALASTTILLYTGLFLYAVSTAFVVPCMTTMASKFGSVAQKGTVMGIFRSLGALARALGPVVASVCYWSLGSTLTYSLGGIALLWPWYTLNSSIR